MKAKNVHFIWNEPRILRRFETAVSLHGHSNHSRESLVSLPKYAEDNVLLGAAVARISLMYRNAMGRDLDFHRSYFVPPLSAFEAYRVEALQIGALGLRPIVSLTDHDTIAGVRQLQALLGAEKAPLSLEWTVPFGSAYFHVGIHNLPADMAGEIVNGLLDVQCSACQELGLSCTSRHDARCLPHAGEWFERLSAIPDALLVLNHPLWDTCGLGESGHVELLCAFMERYGGYLHALELNGLRTWSENERVMEFADHFKMPLISGGDRHGCEPNAVVNLTKAKSFSEFALEIRAGEPSVVLFLRQYRQPLALRKARVIWDVLKGRTSASGERTRWGDRIYVPWIDGRVRPLSSREWSATFANKPVERPQSAAGFPCDTANGAEY